MGKIEKKRVYKIYSPHLRSTVCMDVLSGRLTAREAAVKYGIVSDHSVREWVSLYRASHLEINFDHMASKNLPAAKFSEQQEQEDKKQIKALKKALELAKLENLTLHTMIDIAEEQLNIEIRKKSGTKQ